MKKNNLHIIVLMGGWNNERVISIESGEAVFKSIKRIGYKATKLNFDKNIVDNLLKLKPDIVFNALHGKFGEDGKIQGLLDILSIPYTHSGNLACSIAMNKIMSYKLCDNINIKYPKFFIIEKNNDKNNDTNKDLINKIGSNFVLKPIDEGSSIGVEIFLNGSKFDIDNYKWEFGDRMIIEEYIEGKEINVGIMDDKALGAVEIYPKKNLFYDYESKYTSGMTEYIMPAEISQNKYKEILDLGLKYHKEISCHGISRVDFILSKKDNQFYFLEINTHPGFTKNSLLPKIAKYKNISFDNIVEYLLRSAKCRN